MQNNVGRVKLQGEVDAGKMKKPLSYLERKDNPTSSLGTTSLCLYFY